MCDFSLHNVKSRPAKVGDKLTSRDFGTGTRGFAASENVRVAVCLLPGTELSFAEEVRCISSWPSRRTVIDHKTAIFRQINQDDPMRHHDALEFPDGQIVLLTFLTEGQHATVLQLPAAAVGAKAPSMGPLAARLAGLGRAAVMETTRAAALLRPLVAPKPLETIRR